MGKVFAKDLVGKTFKKFRVLDCKRENNRTYLYVVCPYCKKKTWIRYDTIQSGNAVSCGCQNKTEHVFKKEDLTGEKFGRLTVIKPTSGRSPNGSVIWECKCSCGNLKHVAAYDLKRGRVKSCGCLSVENSQKNGKINGQHLKNCYCLEKTNINNLTMKTRIDNTSGIKGVTWDKERSKWRAQIRFQGKNYTLGRFYSFNDAVKERKIAEEKIFGEFLSWYYNRKADTQDT